MDKFSFIKYVNLKENKLKKYASVLEHKIQYGGSNGVNIKQLQEELLIIKKKLATIKENTDSTVIDPYNQLKDIIDSINLKISKIEEEVQLAANTGEQAKESLLNRIREIDIQLDEKTKGTDYVTITAKDSFKFVKEKIDTDKIGEVSDKYLTDLGKLVGQLKVQLGSGTNLLNNEKIGLMVAEIESKIKSYNLAIGPIDQKLEKIELFIKQMESLYKVEETKPVLSQEKKYDLLDTNFTPVSVYEEDGTKKPLKVNVLAINAKETQFNYGNLEIDSANVAKLQYMDDAKTEDIIKFDFIRPLEPLVKPSSKLEGGGAGTNANSKYSVDLKESNNDNVLIQKRIKSEIISNMYDSWKSKLSNIREKSVKKLETINTIILIQNYIIKIKKINEYILNVESYVSPIFKNKLVKDKEFIKSHLNYLENNYNSCDVEYTKVCDSLDFKNGYYNKLKEDIRYELIKQNPINLQQLLSQLNDIKYNIQVGGSSSSSNPVVGGGANSGGTGSTNQPEIKDITEFYKKLIEFEKIISDIRGKKLKLIKLIKKYNVRYTQFFNFQQYIVTYVSLVIAQDEYKYYKYLPLGYISYYDSILSKLKQIVKRYENPKYFNDNSLDNNQNKIFYIKHFFIINILSKFFRELYTFWDNKSTNTALPNVGGGSSSNLVPGGSSTPHRVYLPEENKWDIFKNVIDLQCENDNGIGNKKYFFLFNIFFRILDAYQSQLPPVANYLRINNITRPGIVMGNHTFKKNNKNFLDVPKIESCPLLDADNRTNISNVIKKTKFEEIFDPEKFDRNENLALYMNLPNMLDEGKSILILTYGYSGVGKTFTLFGRKNDEPTSNSEAVSPPGSPVPPISRQGSEEGFNFQNRSNKYKNIYQPGLLQTTLSDLPNKRSIKIKIFELYGLGVPYNFYWNKDITEFSHKIYHYRLNPNNTNIINDKPVEYENKDFEKVTTDDSKFEELTTEHIDGFSQIIANIDTIRRATGRIKKTKNNPDSSRSIMIYDFKIELNDGKISNFVVMDLPGKENIYQTFCTDESYSGIEDNFLPKQEYYTHNKKPGHLQQNALNSRYNISMIKTMMYMNPLWLSTIPEIAEDFIIAGKGKENKAELFNFSGNPEPTLNTLGSYINSKTREESIQFSQNNNYKQIGVFEPNPRRLDETSFPLTDTDQINQIPGNDIITYKDMNAKLYLFSMFDRSFQNIIDFILDSNLEKLGERINNMLPDTTKEEKERKAQRYGYAGLEGNYINENILGLLQILSEKIQNTNKTGIKPKPVVCKQKEIYTELYKEDKTKVTDGVIEKMKVKPGSKTINFAREDEFLSQIMFMRDTFSGRDEFQYFKNVTDADPYHTKMREEGDISLTFGSTKGITKDIDNNKKNWINNYNYNKIFNMESPPIKSILKKYLEDPKFNNFYLFFVVSNNKKESGLETCDKQVQLIYDTRKFMEMIATQGEADGITEAECDAL